MSPSGSFFAAAFFGFPRVSGDEPAAGNLQATLMGFSPRERG